MSHFANHPTDDVCQRKSHSTATLDYNALYTLLRQRVPTWVRYSRVPSWKGQEGDVVEDVIQVGITRTWKYVGRADRGEVPTIDSVERLCVTIAQNYCRDLRRKEIRLVRPDVDDREYMEYVHRVGGVDAADVAAEEVDNARIFGDISFASVNFSAKMKKALFIDLAQLMHFGIEPTSLQRAFLRYGVDLRQYKDCKPVDAIGRSRHSALLHLAYQRLRRIIQASSYKGLL
jgi:DNA-directed RNA polymerase specialized sigma24 family protein